MFPAIQTRVALTSHMLAFDMFKHPSLEFSSIIAVSTSPYKASVSCSFLPHLHLNHRFVSISATSTLNGEACVGVDRSTDAVVAAVPILAAIVGLVLIRLVLQFDLLLTLLPGGGALLLLGNHLGWGGDRLGLDDGLHLLNVVVVLVVAQWRGGWSGTLGRRHWVPFRWSGGS